MTPGRYKSKSGEMFTTDGISWLWVSGKNKGIGGKFTNYDKTNHNWLKQYTKLSFKEYTKLLCG